MKYYTPLVSYRFSIALILAVSFFCSPLHGAALRLNDQTIQVIPVPKVRPNFARLSKVGLRSPRLEEAGLNPVEEKGWLKVFLLRNQWEQSLTDNSNRIIKAEALKAYQKENEKFVVECSGLSLHGEVLYACLLVELDYLQFQKGKPNYLGIFEKLPTLIEKEPNAEVAQLMAYLLGILYEDSGNTPKAKQFFLAALEEAESGLLPEIYFRLGRIHLFENRYPQAERSFKRVVHGEFFAHALSKLAWTQAQGGKCLEVMKTAARFRMEVIAEESKEHFLKGIEALEIQCTKEGVRLEEVERLDPRGITPIREGLKRLRRQARSRGSRTNFIQVLSQCYLETSEEQPHSTNLRLKLGGTLQAPKLTPFPDRELLKDVEAAIKLANAASMKEAAEEEEPELESALDLLADFGINPQEPLDETYLVEPAIADWVHSLEVCTAQKLEFVGFKGALSGSVWVKPPLDTLN